MMAVDRLEALATRLAGAHGISDVRALLGWIQSAQGLYDDLGKLCGASHGRGRPKRRALYSVLVLLAQGWADMTGTKPTRKWVDGTPASPFAQFATAIVDSIAPHEVRHVEGTLKRLIANAWMLGKTSMTANEIREVKDEYLWRE